MEDEQSCPICYNSLKLEASYAKVEECEHEFCLGCIRKWSQEKEQPTCPCCNHRFEFVLEIKKNGTQVKLDAKSFVKAHKSNTKPKNGSSSTSGPIISDMHWELAQRLGIYKNNMKVKKLTNTRGRRPRAVDAAAYRMHPAWLVRLMPFVRRELQAVVPTINFRKMQEIESKVYHDAQFVGLPRPGRCQYLVDVFDGNLQYVDIFCHELLNFAASPFETVQEYDRAAVYATLQDGELAAASSRADQSQVITLDDTVIGESPIQIVGKRKPATSPPPTNTPPMPTSPGQTRCD